MSRAVAGHSIAVASRLTGIPIETLRAWERRYGFPQPERLDSKRRVYSEKEIARLRWVARAIESGFRAGDVVRRKPAEIEALLDETRPVAPVPETLPTVAALVERLVADDVGGFDAELRRLAAALGPRGFVVDVAHPLAVAVGEEWAAGKLEVRQEHYASESLATQLRTLLASLQDVDGSPKVLLATLPEERHGLGLAMVAVYVAVAGAKPRVLGTSTPVDQIAGAARALDANVVGLTVTPACSTRSVSRDLRALQRALPRRVDLWVGGSGAARLSTDGEWRIVADWRALDAAIERARARA